MTTEREMAIEAVARALRAVGQTGHATDLAESVVSALENLSDRRSERGLDVVVQDDGQSGPDVWIMFAATGVRVWADHASAVKDLQGSGFATLTRYCDSAQVVDVQRESRSLREELVKAKEELAKANLVVEDYKKIRSTVSHLAPLGSVEFTSALVETLSEMLQTRTRERDEANKNFEEYRVAARITREDVSKTSQTWRDKYEKAAKELADVTEVCMRGSGNDDRPLPDIVRGLRDRVYQEIDAKFALQREIAELRAPVLVKQEASVAGKMLCTGCKGQKQVWGIRWTDGENKGWMGRSAFLTWTGTKEEAMAAATKKNNGPLTPFRMYAEQLTCPKCGKTNNPQEVIGPGAR